MRRLILALLAISVSAYAKPSDRYSPTRCEWAAVTITSYLASLTQPALTVLVRDEQKRIVLVFVHHRDVKAASLVEAIKSVYSGVREHLARKGLQDIPVGVETLASDR